MLWLIREVRRMFVCVWQMGRSRWQWQRRGGGINEVRLDEQKVNMESDEGLWTLSIREISWCNLVRATRSNCLGCPDHTSACCVFTFKALASLPCLDLVHPIAHQLPAPPRMYVPSMTHMYINISLKHLLMRGESLRTTLRKRLQAKHAHLPRYPLTRTPPPVKALETFQMTK